jgi:hypothetical protein
VTWKRVWGQLTGENENAVSPSPTGSAVDGRNENAVSPSPSPKLTIMSAVSGRWSVVGIMPNVFSQEQTKPSLLASEGARGGINECEQ